jgi:hypothetical protein
MPSTWIYLEGKVSWVHIHKPNQWNNWSLQLHLSNKSLEYLRELIAEKGLKTQIKKDDDGWFINLKRPTQLTLKTGKIVGLTQPEIFDGQHPLQDKDGKTYYPILVEPIGNGSDAVVKCDLYQYTIPMTNGKKGYALRLNSLRVDSLVPFNRPSFDDGLAIASKGLEDQPARQEAW